jgi:hypothetical protein
MWMITVYLQKDKNKNKYQIDAQHEEDSEVIKLLQIPILFVKRNNNNITEQIKTFYYPGSSISNQHEEYISVKILKYLQTTGNYSQNFKTPLQSPKTLD